MADYQQWQAGDITNGDILDVFGSLGNRPADSVTIESIGGQTTLRFNVAKDVYKEHDHLHNSWVGHGFGSTRSSPRIMDEIEETKPNIVIEADQIQTWDIKEIVVRDIKIITKSSGLKITVT